MITVLEVIWSLLKHTSWDCAQWFGIDRLQSFVLVDIDSWRYRDHWFGIDRLQSCVLVDIDSWQYHVHWFGIDRLQSCVQLLTLIADEIVSGLTLKAKLDWVVPGLLQFWAQFSDYGIYYIYRYYRCKILAWKPSSAWCFHKINRPAQLRFVIPG